MKSVKKKLMISHAEFARVECEEAGIVGRHLILRWFAAAVLLCQLCQQIVMENDCSTATLLLDSEPCRSWKIEEKNSEIPSS